MKTRERDEVIRLRREQGKSVREIAVELGVARSSVSRWVRQVELTPEQLEALTRRNPIYSGQRSGARANAERSLAARRAFQEAGRQHARHGDRRYVAGCMLYWAEGSKSRNSVCFTNSDPAMMAFFVAFLRDYFGVCGDAIRVTCNLYADHARHISEIEDFWLRTLELSRASLLKSTVNTRSAASKLKRVNTLPYGTCRVVLHRTEVVQAIFGSIQEVAGFNRAEWLTC